MTDSELQFVDTIASNINAGIGLIDYERYSLIKSKYQTITNDNENMTIEKIKSGLEKISAFISGKPLHSFVYDFYDNDYGIDEIQIKEVESKINTYNREWINKPREIYQDQQTDSFNSIINALRLTSRDYLRTKLQFSENDIIDIKGAEELPVVDNTPVEEVKIEQPIIITEKIKQINQPKAKNTKSSIFIKTSKEKINKEMEEELFQEVLNNTKSMKNYAKSISDILKNDNKTLSKIENLQNKEQAKTQKEVSSLKEFNKTLQVGFWKTVYMFVIVIITFIFTLLITRIFPKLDKL